MKFFVVNVIFLLILHLNCIQLVKAEAKVEGENPTETISCFHCDNKLDSKCLNNLKELDNTGKCNATKTDGCITYIDPNDKYLYRNCKKDAPPHIASACSDSNTDTCKVCLKNDCNNDENFPEDKRQQCYVCKGNDKNCFLKPNEKLKPEYCPEYPDKCFTYVKDDKTTIRDCLSRKKLSNDICPNSKECIECEKSKCNEESGEIELKCYECSGDDGKCKRTEKKENCSIDSNYNKLCGTILLGRDEPKDVCYIKRNGNYVERGCYLTKKSTIVVERNSTLEKYKSEENGICIMDLECIKCSDNEKCSTDSDDLKNSSDKCDKYVTSCYRHDDEDGKTTRGCNAPSNDQIQTTSFCYENKCIAKKLKVECYSCDSENDENCAQLKNKAALKISECDGNDECATMIKKNGHTVRGCKKIISPNQDCTNNQLCQVCSPKLTDVTPCNGNVFPLDRRQCYQCNNCNDIELNDQQQSQKSYPCHIYKKDDQCYMYANDNIVRGCMSDTKSDDCIKAKEKCYKCAENSCNYHGKMKDPSIKCIKCNSEFNDDCKWGYDQNQATNCLKQLEFWKMEKCYVCNTNGKITRGCESDLKPDASNDECKICAGDGCNNYHAINFTCIRCRSDNEGQESCAQTAENIKPSDCVYPVTKSNRGCFTDRNVNTGVVVRGCLADLYVTDRSKCLDNTYEYCQNCLESNCNNQEISGSIKSVTISIINILLSIFIINFIN